ELAPRRARSECPLRLADREGIPGGDGEPLIAGGQRLGTAERDACERESRRALTLESRRCL
ncbi:MAG TPA: hypothetical protein VGQ47_03560, partial [Candidatus Limnocylindrales bacterium]|nr:hypothetical protein [Candidatus Limnocylindrales bacterium]